LGLLTSCSSLGLGQPSGTSVLDAYYAGHTNLLTIREGASPLEAKKPIPILSQPEAFAVFVPSKVDRKKEILIGEHWVFIKLREAEWFSDRGPEGELSTQGVASEAELAPLKILSWENAVVPFKKAE
jgi:hypothetical protein